jgi:polyferredoxin
MINAAKFFAVLAAVMLLQLLQNKINVRKEERGRQVYFPLIALIYVALSAFLDLRLYFWIKSLNPYGREGGIFLAIYRWLRSVTALRNFSGRSRTCFSECCSCSRFHCH